MSSFDSPAKLDGGREPGGVSPPRERSRLSGNGPAGRSAFSRATAPMNWLLRPNGGEGRGPSFGRGRAGPAAAAAPRG